MADDLEILHLRAAISIMAGCLGNVLEANNLKDAHCFAEQSLTHLYRGFRSLQGCPDVHNAFTKLLVAKAADKLGRPDLITE